MDNCIPACNETLQRIRANGINRYGVAVGQGLVTTSSFHAFLYSGGQMVDLGGGYQASASATNDSGQVVGNGTTGGAFLYSNGKMVSLGVPSGTTGSGANAINSIGRIVGAIYFNSGPSHAADLGAFSGAAGASARNQHRGPDRRYCSLSR